MYSIEKYYNDISEKLLLTDEEYDILREYVLNKYPKNGGYFPILYNSNLV